jgi:hypothetical protein
MSIQQVDPLATVPRKWLRGGQAFLLDDGLGKCNHSIVDVDGVPRCVSKSLILLVIGIFGVQRERIIPG